MNTSNALKTWAHNKPQLYWLHLADSDTALHIMALIYSTDCFKEETGRLSRTDNHVVLMQNFLRALGISDAERNAEQPLPTTWDLIDYRL